MLKLIALDEDDLDIISSHVQDGVTQHASMKFTPKTQQFSITLNRFVWEKAVGKGSKTNERRRSVLHFNRVSSVRSKNIDLKDKNKVQSLLALQFKVGEHSPEGTLELTFAKDAVIELDVECIEIQLNDLGSAWEASSKPRHKAD